MRIYVYGEKNSNLDVVLPYLAYEKISDIPDDVLRIAISEKILKYDINNKVVPGDRFALITGELLELKNESLKYIKILEDNIDYLKRTFKSSSLYKQGYTWDELQHIIIFGLCLDFGILKKLYSKGVIEKLERKYYLWGFDSSIETENPFGIKLWLSKFYKMGFAQLWNPSIECKDINLNDKCLDILYSINNTDEIIEMDSKSLLILKYYGLIDEEQCKYRILIPIIDQDEDSEFYNCIDKICLKIVEEVTLPNLDKYDSTPVFRHGIVRLLMEFCSDLLIQNNLVAPFNSITKPYQRSWLFTNLYKSDCIANKLDY